MLHKCRALDPAVAGSATFEFGYGIQAPPKPSRRTDSWRVRHRMKERSRNAEGRLTWHGIANSALDIVGPALQYTPGIVS
jgi:hypothetical protein